MNRFIALIGLLAMSAAFAIEPPKDAPTAQGTPETKDAPATEEPAKPDEDAAKPAESPPEADDEELPPLPPDAVPAGPPPQRFNPTEKVRADFPISFPIDI